jgi:hypothetical protein
MPAPEQGQVAPRASGSSLRQLSLVGFWAETVKGHTTNFSALRISLRVQRIFSGTERQWIDLVVEEGLSNQLP